MGSLSNIGTLSLIAVPGEIENRYFLNNPDITFFKSVYRRHTNFSKFLAKDDYTRTDNNAFGETVTYDLGKTIGDLLSKVYLQHKIIINPDSGASITEDLTICSNLGTNIISNSNTALKLEIGSNTIYQCSDLYQETKAELLNEISLSASGTSFTVAPPLDFTTPTISCKSGSHYNYTTLSGGVRGVLIAHAAITGKKLSTEYFYMIPEFSFMKDYGLSIPLLCLRNEDIRFTVEYKSQQDIFSGDNTAIISGAKLESSCIKEYIHLDTEEKKRFIMNSHEYLTEYVRYVDVAANELTGPLSGISGLTKYILIVGDPNVTTSASSISTGNSTPIKLTFETLNLLLDNNKLNPNDLSIEVFTRLNLHKYFPGCGRDVGPTSGSIAKNYGHLDTIAMFPIAIDPTNYTQPSGCISNIHSGVKNLTLEFTAPSGGATGKMKVFVVEYNLLSISDGRCQKILT
jgi:hypothetical protein